MEWLNIRTPWLRQPEYIGSAPRDRATWVNVLSYCVEQENSGRIVGAKRWKCRQWQQTCGVTLREVNGATKLLSWDGDDVVVWNYPVEKQQDVQAKREAGRRGGQATTQTKVEASKQNGANGGRPKTQAETEAQTQAETEAALKQKPNGIGIGMGIGKEAKAARVCLGFLPESLNTPAMTEAWDRWLVHWSQAFAHGKPMPEQTAHAQLRKLVELGPMRSIAAIDNAIIKGNLKEPAEPFANASRPAPTPTIPRDVKPARSMPGDVFA